MRPGRATQPVEIFDTTLRDGSQAEGLSLTVTDKTPGRRAARPLGVQYIEGGWPGANPKDREFFERAASGRARPGRRQAGRIRRHAGRRAAGPRPTRSWPISSGPAPVMSAWWPSRRPGTSPRHCARRRSRRSTWSPTRSPSCATTGRSCWSTLSIFSTGTSKTLVSPRDFPPGRRAVRRHAGALRHQRRHVASPGRAGRGRGAPDTTSGRLGVHFHNDSGCAVANSVVAVLPGRGPRTGLHQRLRRAHRQRRPDGGHRQPQPEARHRDDRSRAPGFAHPGGPPHCRDRQHRAEPAPALRRPVGFRPQSRHPHERDRPRPERVLPRRPGGGRQHDPFRRSRRCRAARLSP